MTAKEFLREAEIRVGMKRGRLAVEFGIYPSPKPAHENPGRLDDTARKQALEDAIANIPPVRFQ